MTLITGSLTTIRGPMFSGKSTELARLVRREKIAGRKCLIIKYYKDLRYGNGLCNHDGVIYEFCDITHAKTLGSINIAPYDVIGIDEGQFFDDILIADEWSSAGKIVIASGLDLNYRREQFKNFCELCTLAEHQIHLNAVCGCGKIAHYTWLDGNHPASGILIGNATNGYRAVCRTCYNRFAAFSNRSIVPMAVDN